MNAVQSKPRRVTGGDHSRREILAGLGTAGAVGLAGCSVLGGTERVATDGTDESAGVERLWRADTSTEYAQNHHKLGTTQVDGEHVVGVPLSEYPDTVGCGLVGLGSGGEIRWREQLPKSVCDPHSIGDVGTGTIDGEQVFVVSTIEGESVAYHAGSGDRLFEADLIETIPYSEPVLTPPLSDGDRRIVVLDNSAYLVVGRLDGTVDWRHDADGVTYPAPVVADVNGDGVPEIVVAVDQASGWVVAFSMDGSVLWETEFESGGRGLIALEREHGYDIAVSTWDGQVAAIDGTDGEIRWQGEYARRGILGEYDEEHLYTTEGDGVVHAIDRSDGSLAWTTSSLSSTAPANAPVVGESALDGGPAVGTLTYDGTLGLLDPATGRIELEHQFGSETFTSPLLVDVTGDDRQDVVVMFGDGRTEAFALEL
jgi:outer membrane protein assembly factor BamB